jgi:IS30 family transposase
MLKNQESCFLTLNERMGRREVIYKMKSCKVEEVDKVITEMEKKSGRNFRKIFKTIIAENSPEFSD